MKYTVFKIVTIVLIIIVLVSSCIRTRVQSQDAMADEAEKQTKE